MRRANRGFSLIELLVVIAIITVLLAILSPTLSRIHELTRITICGSHLHEYGVAIAAYGAANKGAVMKIVHEWGNAPYPDYIRRDTSQNGEWGIKQINPYIKSFDMDKKFVGGISMCPSVDIDIMNRFIKERNFPNHTFIEYQYFYWGRVDIVNAAYVHNGADRDLVGKHLAGGRVLMTDALYFDASDWNNSSLGAWRYNHGPKGWAFNEYTYLPQDFGDYPNISGINRLFGDGSVGWKRRAEFKNLHLMQSPGAYPDGFIGHSSHDSFFY